MVEVNFDGETYQLDRVISKIKSKEKKSILVFIGGIHGNEPTGVVALKKVFKELQKFDLNWLGDVYAFTGNLKALAASKRFIDKDLNRVWTPNEVLKVKQQSLEKKISETEEQYALYDLIWPLLEEKAPIYFIDLHTTSSPSKPFVTINDILINRDYSMKFPTPIVLGIEEYITGPLLSYMNNLETVSLAYEGGQHDEKEAVENHVSFIHLAMVYAGVISKEDLPNFDFHNKRLTEKSKDVKGIYEIRFKKGIEKGDEFKMEKGFSNFDPITKNQLIATDKKGEIRSPENGRIFMPLYQKQGNDGFFIIREIPQWALSASRILRVLKIDSLLTVLPGVTRDEKDSNSLRVSIKTTKVLGKNIFHLLGYRRKKKTNDSEIYFSKREID